MDLKMIKIRSSVYEKLTPIEHENDIFNLYPNYGWKHPNKLSALPVNCFGVSFGFCVCMGGKEGGKGGGEVCKSLTVECLLESDIPQFLRILVFGIY